MKVAFKAMSQQELLARITIDPAVCHGRPCIGGHRIWVSLILDMLAAGQSTDGILAIWPELTERDIRACIAYGSEMTRDNTEPLE